MLHVGCHSLQPVSQQLAQGTDILILRRQNANRLRLGQQFLFCIRTPDRGIMILQSCRCSSLLQLAAPLVTQGKPRSYSGGKSLRHKIGIGYRSKHTLYNELVCGRVGNA
ncbi:hypothetical protein D3C75_816470 [compost metagenome]